jgi:hypothetical protein
MQRVGMRRLIVPLVALAFAAAGCAVVSTPGDTSQIQLVSTTTQSGWQIDFYRNTAYPCSASGYQTFVVASPVGVAPTTRRPLWVYMHGGGVGWFDASGTPQPDSTFLTEESSSSLAGALGGGGLFSLVRADPAGFRLMAVSMCNHVLFGGGGLADPNNPNALPGGGARTTNGLFATKAAVQYAQAHYGTTKFFLHGTSAGSFGTYSVAWGLQSQGDPPAGIVADAGVVNFEWSAAIGAQQVPTCSGITLTENGHAQEVAARMQPQLADPANEPDKLVADGRLTVPIAHVWNHADDRFCGGPTPQDVMTCPLRDGSTVSMRAVDCANEPLRRSIAAQGPSSRSINLPVCVTTGSFSCNKHVITNINGTNTDPASPADYNGALIGWVDARLVDS